ncbi:Radical SAM domain, pyruvate-formate lyase-activating enzyme [Thioalkalivibrio nitratireducens DSM 14787]|uniref:Radical SAM domain, pyruvate-formate lyase-activating enzyme n=1 Tax=Thioalkalivibrio nitratireducens (strain DSM 14787 / UNIQEM 213 / ALEN2) TaxID=1255043 RepID=L0DTQ4_THIND|nr:AmmeMemoRadiSam system radical SAM enzyme [Thioalkalivibrio nitratireducens]AGA32984.1 Radical SAM domain, pyruvate-formate lyase-activating enzyme [Thioalkalivibrio nitratireducens DSM 14787]
MTETLARDAFTVATRYWDTLADGRVQCDLCPRLCKMKPGQRGACFVRANLDGEVVLTTYGRSSGYCIDPIEKKPLNHFLPGTPVLSFGTAGCNLACKFCQNWDISKSRELDTLMDRADPETIARAAVTTGCRAVAFTYNDPVIFHEYAQDVARACREQGIRTVAVTANYISEAARAEFYAGMDAANVDLKAFSERFYHRLTGAHLQPVLDNLEWLVHETGVWVELTTLLIPGENDGDDEIRQMCEWVIERLGPQVPMHFTAFHPDFRMTEYPPTPVETLRRARRIARNAGVHHAYTGNAWDPDGQSTWCPACNRKLIGRSGYEITAWNLDGEGRCDVCATPLAGVFELAPGQWGARRVPVRLAEFAPHP